MSALGPYLAACALLVAAGADKTLRPRSTARALAAFVSVPVGTLAAAVRFGAAFEVVVGLVAAARPSTATAAAVAATYAGFTVFSAFAWIRGGALGTCGCFSTPDTPATAGHVVLDAALAAAAACVAASGGQRWLPVLLGHQPLDGAALVAAALVTAWLSYLVLVPLARLHAVRREFSEPR